MSTKHTVKAGDTGAIRGDGSGTRTFTTVPKPPGLNVTTNAGRHATGQPLARIGNIRPGQGPSGSGVGTGVNAKTGVPSGAPIRSMAPRPSIPADQKDTSTDLEKRLMARPQPFTYDTLAATLPTDRINGATLGIEYNVMAPVDAKPQSYGSPVMSDKEMLAAVGKPRKPQSYNAINNFRGSGSQRQAGQPGTSTPKRASRGELARLRQTGY